MAHEDKDREHKGSLDPIELLQEIADALSAAAQQFLAHEK